MIIKQCKNCRAAVEAVFSLGRLPLVNSFLTKKQIVGEKKFDLTVGFCRQCYLVQLTKTVPPADLFRNYIYFSSTSSSLLKHCEEISSKLVRRLGLTAKSLVLEIASNDGALLRYFLKIGGPRLWGGGGAKKRKIYK